MRHKSTSDVSTRPLAPWASATLAEPIATAGRRSVPAERWTAEAEQRGDLVHHRSSPQPPPQDASALATKRASRGLRIADGRASRMELRSVHAHRQDFPPGSPDEQVPRHLRVENPTWRRRADRPLQRLPDRVCPRGEAPRPDRRRRVIVAASVREWNSAAPLDSNGSPFRARGECDHRPVLRSVRTEGSLSAQLWRVIKIPS
jgi:hypothetical protein